MGDSFDQLDETSVLQAAEEMLPLYKDLVLRILRDQLSETDRQRFLLCVNPDTSGEAALRRVDQAFLVAFLAAASRTAEELARYHGCKWGSSEN